MEFSNYLIREYEDDRNFPCQILWSHEATYQGSGLFNAYNEHYWAEENPFLAREGLDPYQKYSDKISHTKITCDSKPKKDVKMYSNRSC